MPPHRQAPPSTLIKYCGEYETNYSGNNPLFLHITLVPHQDDLGIVPGVGLYLSSPKERQEEDCVIDTLLGQKGPQEAHRSPFNKVAIPQAIRSGQ